MRKLYYIENKLNTAIKIPQLNLEFKPKEIKAVDSVLIHRYMHKIRKALLLGQIKFTTRDRYLFFKKKHTDLTKEVNNTTKKDTKKTNNKQTQQDNNSKTTTTTKKSDQKNNNSKTTTTTKKSGTKKSTTKKEESK